MKFIAGLLFVLTTLQLYVLVESCSGFPRDPFEASENLDALSDSENSIAAVAIKIILPPPAVSCNCAPQYIPICGDDGNTYGNLCLLNCISDARVARGFTPVYFKINGVCPKEPCSCSLVYDPVCGDDRFTYYNECFLDCENKRRQKLGLTDILIKLYGPCRVVPVPICPSNVLPVCGTDNVTYRNFCFLQLASHLSQLQGGLPIFFQNLGKCKTESCSCPNKYKPVCASNDETFDNQCLLDCENRRREALGLNLLTRKHYGTCCNCPKTWDPICASNGKTYRNPCILKCLNDYRINHNLPPLITKYKGTCVCNCNRCYDPVCGTDGKTYPNLCRLVCEINRRKELGLKPIWLNYYGVCICNCNHCSVVYSPVCGSDGKTYWNYCWLKCHSDCNVKENRPIINFIKFGYC